MGDGIDALAAAVRAEADRYALEREVVIDHANGRALAFVGERAEIVQRHAEEHCTRFLLRIAESDLERLLRLGARESA